MVTLLSITNTQASPHRLRTEAPYQGCRWHARDYQCQRAKYQGVSGPAGRILSTVLASHRSGLHGQNPKHAAFALPSLQTPSLRHTGVRHMYQDPRFSNSLLGFVKDLKEIVSSAFSSWLGAFHLLAHHINRNTN